MISLDILQQFICGYWDMKSYALLELKVLGNERLFLCGLSFPPRIPSATTRAESVRNKSNPNCCVGISGRHFR